LFQHISLFTPVFPRPSSRLREVELSLIRV
jgi:hypothetical protein